MYEYLILGAIIFFLFLLFLDLISRLIPKSKRKKRG